MNVIEAFNQWFSSLDAANQQALLRYLNQDNQQTVQSSTRPTRPRQPKFGGRNLGSAATSRTCPHCGRPI